MPYIITTYPQDMEPAVALEYGTGRHRAVATLDEAMQAAQDVIDNGPPITSKVEWMALCDAVIEIPESGGTVGPLPDGTVIEVERVAKTALAWDRGLSPRLPIAEIIDAYNAQAAS